MYDFIDFYSSDYRINSERLKGKGTQLKRADGKRGGEMYGMAKSFSLNIT